MKVLYFAILVVVSTKVCWSKSINLNENIKNSPATNTDSSNGRNQNLANKQTSGSSMVIMYKPKEYDTNLADDETEMLEAMRDIEKNASSKHVLNLFRLMDKDRDGRLSYEELLKFLNYDDE